MTENITIKITLDKKLHDEFIRNSLEFFGYSRSHRRDGIMMAMQILNNYFKTYENERLIDIAKKNNVEPFMLSRIIIKRFISLHKYMGTDISLITDEEHEEKVKECLKKMGH